MCVTTKCVNNFIDFVNTESLATITSKMATVDEGIPDIPVPLSRVDLVGLPFLIPIIIVLLGSCGTQPLGRPRTAPSLMVLHMCVCVRLALFRNSRLLLLPVTVQVAALASLLRLRLCRHLHASYFHRGRLFLPHRPGRW